MRQPPPRLSVSERKAAEVSAAAWTIERGEDEPTKLRSSLGWARLALGTPEYRKMMGLDVWRPAAAPMTSVSARPNRLESPVTAARSSRKLSWEEPPRMVRVTETELRGVAAAMSGEITGSVALKLRS